MQAPGTAPVTTKIAVNGSAKNTQSKSQDPEFAAVEAATLAFIKASKSGSASAITRTKIRAISKGLHERTKWASRAGMIEYKEFVSNFVHILNNEITGDELEVSLAMKTTYEGTDNMCRKVQKYNRTEAFVHLKKESGGWKATGHRYSLRVWNESGQ